MTPNQQSYDAMTDFSKSVRFCSKKFWYQQKFHKYHESNLVRRKKWNYYCFNTISQIINYYCSILVIVRVFVEKIQTSAKFEGPVTQVQHFSNLYATSYSLSFSLSKFHVVRANTTDLTWGGLFCLFPQPLKALKRTSLNMVKLIN